MKKLLYILSILITLTVSSQTPYIEYEVPAAGNRVGMVINRPQTIVPGGQYKLIIAHPGIGERGSGSDKDLDKLRTVGNWESLEKRIKQKGNYILIEVQPRLNYEDGETDEALQWARKEYATTVNWKTVYLTGLSLGGGGSQRYLAYNPFADTIFAASAIVCAGPNQYFITNGDQGYKNIAKYAASRSIWFLHSKDDSTAPPRYSTDLTISKIKAIIPNVNVRRTLYKYENHGAWIRAYGDNPAATPGLAEDYNDPVAGVLEYFELNELGKPAQFLRRVSDPAPVPIPVDTVVPKPIDTVVVQPVPVDTVVISKPVTIVGWSISIDPKSPGFFVEAVYSDGTKHLTAGSKTNRIINAWIPVLLPGKERASIYFENKITIAVGPGKPK